MEEIRPTTWDGAKTPVNHGTFTISTGFSRRISEPSTVSNTTTIECDDAYGLGGQPATSPPPMYDPYIFQATFQPSNCGPAILCGWVSQQEMNNPPMLQMQEDPVQGHFACCFQCGRFQNPWTHVNVKFQAGRRSIHCRIHALNYI